MNNKYDEVKAALLLCMTSESVQPILEQFNSQIEADPDALLEVISTIRDFSMQNGCSFGTAFSMFRQCRNVRDWNRLKNLDCDF